MVTSEFYAKANLQSNPEHFVEIMSSPSIEANFILRIRLQASEQQLSIYEDTRFEENIHPYDKINGIIFPQHQIFIIRDKSAFLEKAISIDPKSIDAKQDFILNISKLIESARKLEIWFNELFSYQGR